MKDELVDSNLEKRHFRKVISLRILLGLSIAAASFPSFLLIFKIGYGINDDIVMISVVAGAFGKASEFLVHSNILWGLFLKLLYQLPTNFNWEVILFVIIDFLSIWVLLYLLLSAKTTRMVKALFVISVLIGNGYFLLSISFTAIAAISAIAGLSLLFFQSQESKKWFSLASLCGIGLILISSLIRSISTLMVAVLFLPAILLNLRIFLQRRFFLSIMITTVLIAGGIIFNKIYLDSSPSWTAFYSYNNAHAQLINTPHFENSQGIYSSVGWSQNDYDLMYRWFFADGVTFSPTRMLDLVHLSSGFATTGTVAYEFQTRIFTFSVIPYLLLLGFGALLMLCSTKSQKAFPTMLLVFITPLLILFGLAFTQKLVNYVTIPLIMGSIVLEFLLCDFFVVHDAKPRQISTKRSPGRIAFLIILFVTFLSGVGTNAYSLFQTSKNNQVNHIAFEGILAQLNQLHSVDDLGKAVRIFDLSGSGIPWDWSNPWMLPFPKLPLQIMGWLTFSPPFNQSVSQLGVKSLPDALSQKDNAYLVSEPGIVPYIEKYFQEHDGIQVVAIPVIAIQSTDSWIYRFSVQQ